MQLAKRAQEVLDQAEVKLAAIAGEAMATKEYDLARRLLSLAQQLGTLSSAPDETPQERSHSLTPSGAASNGVSPSPHAPSPSSTRADGTARPQAAVSRPPKRIVGGQTYPRFYRGHDETLIKIGYSKSQRRQYEHRSPRGVLDHLATVLAEMGADDRQFTTEELFNPAAPRLPDYPSYQTYLCLAFMVNTQLLTRFGRQGYKLSPGGTTDFPAAVRAAFERLSTH